MGLRKRRYARERLYVLSGLALASALSLGLEGFREVHYHGLGFRFLIWNLVLAWIPLLLAVLVYDRYRGGTRLVRLSPAIALWLLFLPNAPYIFTDFIHLSRNNRPPLWFDGLELSTFAFSGLLLGFVSLYLVHAVARHRFGARLGWSGVLVVLSLVSVGVFLGRFKRWNSWDLISQPGKRLAELTSHLHDPASIGRAVGLTLALTVLLAAGYAVFYLLLGARLESQTRD
jgi:uncharacterized membrane protein